MRSAIVAGFFWARVWKGRVDHLMVEDEHHCLSEILTLDLKRLYGHAFYLF